MIGLTETNTELGNTYNTFSITREERQALWDREFKEHVQLPKEELVKMIIGRRPI